MELTYHEFHQCAERIAAKDAAFKAAYDKSNHDIMGFIQYFMEVCGAEYLKQQGRNNGGACGDTHELDVQSHMVHYFTEYDKVKSTDLPIESLITFRLNALKKAGEKLNTKTTAKTTKPSGKPKKEKVVSMDPQVVATPDADDDDWGMEEPTTEKPAKKTTAKKKTTKPKAKPIVEDDDDDWGM